MVGVVVFRFGGTLGLTLSHWTPNVGMLDYVANFVRDLTRGTHCIDEAGTNRIARHLRELGAFFVLREGKTASRLYGAESCGSVTACPGKKDADSTAAACFGERFKELIDGYIGLLRAPNK